MITSLHHTYTKITKKKAKADIEKLRPRVWPEKVR